MATVLEFPRPNGSADSAASRSLPTPKPVFWRSHELQSLADSLQLEFPRKASADIGHAISFAKVALHPEQGREGLAKYVRAILRDQRDRLAA